MFNTIEDAIIDFRNGKIVVVVDDEGRENEGDFILAAEAATPDAINFMARQGRGLICVAMTAEHLEKLEIDTMVKKNTASLGTNFTVSVDVKEGVTTGISASDRARTIQALAKPDSKPDDFARPGHIFPIKAQQGGVLVRAGHTEAVVDFARAAGMKCHAGVLCEIMDEDGSMARRDKLMKVAAEFNLKIVSIADLIEYRRRHEKLVERAEMIPFPTKYGNFTLHMFTSPIDDNEHLAIVKGDVNVDKPVLVRVHSQCLTGDIFGSQRCDCGEQLSVAMKIIENEKQGVLLYMRQEGRGIGLRNKIRAYRLQDSGADTVEANEALGFKSDLRHYGIGAQILYELGVRKIRLLTNNPRKVVGLEGYGLKIVERIPVIVPSNDHNARYLKTKKDKLGHLFTEDDISTVLCGDEQTDKPAV